MNCDRQLDQHLAMHHVAKKTWKCFTLAFAAGMLSVFSIQFGVQRATQRGMTPKSRMLSLLGTDLFRVRPADR